MKTTNFALSKKLEEIGFKAETSTAKAMLGTKDYPAYQLETILDALPKELKSYGELGSLFRSDTFILGYNLQDFESFGQLLQYKMRGENLADTAARLLISLSEKELVKFKQKQ